MAYILPPGVSFCGEYNPTPDYKTLTLKPIAMWKEFEVELVDNRLNDLGVDTSEDSLIMIKTDEIIYYFKSVDKNDVETVTIYFKGGANVDLRIKYEDFKKIMQH